MFFTKLPNRGLYRLLGVTLLGLILSSGVCPGQTQGTQLEISTIPPDSITACGKSELFHLEITNITSNQIDSLTIRPELPPGIRFKFGSQTANLSGLSLHSLNQPNDPVFKFPCLKVGQALKITFSANADCDAINYQQNGNQVINRPTINFLEKGSPFIQEEIDPESYNVLFADLILLSISNKVYIGNLGDRYVRRIEIVNGGNGALSSFTVREALGNGILLTGSSRGQILPGTAEDTIVLSGNDFAQNNHPSSNRDSLFNQNERIVLYDTIQIKACNPGNTDFTLEWGCFGKACSNYGDVGFANTLIGQGTADVIGEFQNLTKTTYCGSNTGSMEVEFKNKGVDIDPGGGRAMDLELVIRTAPGSVQKVLDFKLNGISVSNLGLSPLIRTRTNYREFILQLSNLTTFPGGLNDLDSDGQFDDLAVDSSFTIEIIYSLDCPAGFTNRCAANFQHVLFGPRLYYSQQCGIRNERYPSRNLGGRVNNNALLKNDLDARDGEIKRFCFKQVYVFNGLNYSDYNHDTIFAEVEIPPHWVPTSQVAYINGNPASYTLNGNTLTITGTRLTGDFNSYVRNANLEFCVDLRLDCGKRGGPGTDSIKWRQYIILDSTCTCPVQIGCGINQIESHCPCPGGLTTSWSFEVERESFGWTDHTMQTKVTRNTQGLVLDRVYPCDTFLTIVKGSLFGMADSAWVDVWSDVPMMDTLLFPVEAWFEIFDSSSGQTINCSSPLPTPDTLNNGYLYRFKLNPCLGYKPGAGDSLNLFARFRVKRSLNIPVGRYILPNFRAQHYAAINGKIDFCEGWGAKLEIFRPRAEINNSGYTHNVCDLNVRRLRFENETLGSSDDFPFEFRPFNRPGDTITYILPNNMRYVQGSAAFYTQESNQEIPISDPIYNPQARSLKFIGSRDFSTSWPLTDRSKTGLSYLIFNLESSKPCLNDPPSTRDTFLLDWTTYIFTEDSNCWRYWPNFLFDLRFTTEEKPALSISPLLATQDAFEKEIVWPVRLCNEVRPNTDPAYGSYLHIQNPNGNLILASAVDTSNGKNESLQTYPDGTGGWLINTRPFGLPECKTVLLSFINTSCMENSIDSLEMEFGFACDSVRTLADRGCASDTTTLYVNPKKANLQMVVKTPSGNNFPVCDTLVYDLDLISSRLANMYNISVSADFPQGMYLVGSEFQYPLSGQFISVGYQAQRSNLFTFQLDSLDPTIAANGLPGIRDTTINQARLRLMVLTDCNYASGSTIRFQVQGLTNCDSLIVLNFQTDPQFIQGNKQVYTTGIKVTTPGFNQCRTSSFAEFNILHTGGGTVTTGDSIAILLPPFINYVSGSFQALNQAPGHVQPSISASVSGTVLRWALPPGLQAGDSSVFRIGLQSPGFTTCLSLPLNVKTTFKDTVICSSQGGSCFLDGQSGDTTIQVPFLRPDLILLAANAHTGCKQSVISYQLSNQGMDWNGNNTIWTEVWCDTDSTGGFSPSDYQLGTSLFSNAIAVGDTTTFTDTLSGACPGPYLIALRLDSNCICMPSVLSVQPVKDSILTFPTGYADFTYEGSCINEDVVFMSSDTSQQTHIWDFGDGGMSVIPNPVYQYTNAGKYTVTHVVTSNCGADTNIQILNFNPPPAVQILAPGQICEVDTVKLQAVGAATYSWSTGSSGNMISFLLDQEITISVIGRDSLGCEGTDTLVLSPATLATASISCCQDTFIECGQSAVLNFEFTGLGPWVFSYFVGPRLMTDTAYFSPYSLPVSPLTTTTWEMNSVYDQGSGCPGIVCGKATVGVNKACGKSNCINLTFNQLPNGNNIPAGTMVQNQFTAWGVTISAWNNVASHPNAALIFNSSVPTGQDDDLGTPNQDFGGPGIGNGGKLGQLGENNSNLGNILIIAENVKDTNQDQLVDDPDDEARGGRIFLDFQQPVRIDSFTVIDLDDNKSWTVVYELSNGNTIQQILPRLGDNSVYKVCPGLGNCGTSSSGLDSVVKMTLHLPGSGALAELYYCLTCKQQCLSTQITGFQPVGSCAWVDVELNCDTACAGLLPDFVDFSIPCAKIDSIIVPSGLQAKVISNDSITGLSGFRVSGLTQCNGLQQFSFLVCGTSGLCQSAMCPPMIAYRSALCMVYSKAEISSAFQKLHTIQEPEQNNTILVQQPTPDPNHTGNLKLEVFPNPVSGIFNAVLSYPEQQGKTVKFRLIDMTGRLIEEKTSHMKNGTAKASFNSSILPAGMYLMICKINGQTQTKLVIRQ